MAAETRQPSSTARHSSNPALVLPKLREENERGKGRAGAKAKKKGVKDVVVEGVSRLLISIVFMLGAWNVLAVPIADV